MRWAARFRWMQDGSLPRVRGRPADPAPPHRRRRTPLRMRGRLRHHRVQTDIGGNTPADAGTTSANTAVAVMAREHPRGCGDDSGASRRNTTLRGTPPRMRGRPQGPQGAQRYHRNTPADAGTTSIPSRLPASLVWNTPADAGTTPRCRGPTPALAEHPRGCGDDSAMSWTDACPRGTPPRMRGRHLRPVAATGGHRNTPADAGTTRTPNWPRSSQTEHPRGCGDDSSAGRHSMLTCGTPPRMRGRHHVVPDALNEGRNTPADAGTTFSSSPFHWLR